VHGHWLLQVAHVEIRCRHGAIGVGDLVVSLAHLILEALLHVVALSDAVAKTSVRMILGIQDGVVATVHEPSVLLAEDPSGLIMIRRVLF
jgi:hypothetical protein